MKKNNKNSHYIFCGRRVRETFSRETGNFLSFSACVVCCVFHDTLDHVNEKKLDYGYGEEEGILILFLFFFQKQIPKLFSELKRGVFFGVGSPPSKSLALLFYYNIYLKNFFFKCIEYIEVRKLLWRKENAVNA